MPRIDRFSWAAALCLFASLGGDVCIAQDGNKPEGAGDIVEFDAQVRPEGIVAFTEGPAWHPSGNVYFTDIFNNRVMRCDPQEVFHIERTPSGRANGLLFDREGRLMACEGADEGGMRRVTRMEPDGTLTVLADAYQGKKLNSPNDLAIDSKNRVYFTDPRYGDRSDMQQLDAEGKPVEGVYRIDPDGKIERVIGHEVQRPNGIAVSADDKWLFVVDNNNGTVDGNRKLWRFNLTEQGTIEPDSKKLLHDFGRGRGGDGMALDAKGRLYVAAGFNVPNLPLETTDNPAGIYVFTPEGEQVGFIPVLEDMVTNCTFGGPDLKTLYITSGHKLWSVPVSTPGQLAWPPAA